MNVDVRRKQMCFIDRLAREDFILTDLPLISQFNNQRDPSHLSRRQQQRAISDSMIEVAIAYGKRRRFHAGAIAFPLTDRVLESTIYRKFIDRLRGLTVICHQTPSGYEVHTAYWDYTIKAKSLRGKKSSLTLAFC